MNDEPARRVHTVRDFANGMAEWFKGRKWLQNISISGELSGLREFGNGHLGFTLKDREAILECILWSDRRTALPDLKDGDAVVVTGAIRIRPEKSGYQMHGESIEHTGIGALYAHYERLKEQFRAEGLFDASRKRDVPPLPRRVALVSARGKAMEDFMNAIASSVPFVKVEFIETRVQGTGAEIDIATALDAASARDVDVVVLTRGGGSYEDRYPFNLEPVVRAIVRSRHPVLTAIGHETDHHLADDVADMRFGTPSFAAAYIAKGWLFAAERLATVRRDLRRAAREAVLRGEQRVEHVVKDLALAGHRIMGAKRAAFAAATGRLEARSPQRGVANERERLAGALARMTLATNRLLSRKAHAWGESRSALDRVGPALLVNVHRRLERAEAGLDRNDPLSPLRRGYAILSKDGKAVRDAKSVAPGDLLEATLERGTLRTRVESVRDE